MKYVVNITMVIVNILMTMITLSMLWGWFIVPLGVVSIGYAHAFGLTLIVAFFQVRNATIFNPEVVLKRTYQQKLFTNFGMVSMALLIGYITSLFM